MSAGREGREGGRGQEQSSEDTGRKETGEKLLMKELKAGGMALSKPPPAPTGTHPRSLS